MRGARCAVLLSPLPGLDGWRAEDRAAVYNDMNRILAELHNLDYVAKGEGRRLATSPRLVAPTPRRRRRLFRL